MKSKNDPWNKLELKTYILLLCANSDSKRSKEEINLIKSKVDSMTFKKINKEFKKDSEEESLKKIDDNVQLHEFSYNELEELKSEMNEIFKSDKEYNSTERNIFRILDNILY
ncbi:MAG: hypothetical protein HKO81_01205 [Flavobacteriaceae bacterium]|nr:hypothetical protein [Bacteroidia bacterium]NNL15241.1 hypothetical protein [Flavobacteriaceae bacterium]